MCLVEKAKSMHKDVVARTMIENKASIRVMEKAGGNPSSSNLERRKPSIHIFHRWK